MYRSKGDMELPRDVILLLTLFILAVCHASPLPNVTSVNLGHKEGSCAVGDVVYMSGDDVPGTGPCERCTCAAGDVRCEKQRCEPRPGCKAVHRPDHCCPTYQCDCELDGRVYSNGEKLVDAEEPCRVCYCQGGEVVCRRVACFVRDDCRPRLVPGRCCPEYDNCPLRGVTSLPGISSPVSSMSIEEISIDPPPAQSHETIKPEITIKEITPVSEIPIITDVRIKEIMPSSEIDHSDYSSSKSPLITREATSEKSPSNADANLSNSTDMKMLPIIPSSSTSDLSTASIINSGSKTKNPNDLQPSKINFSTKERDDGTVIPFKIPSIIPLMGGLSITEIPGPLTTKAPSMILQDEDFDHNPAFPPIPDDLSVLSNHEDEIVPEQNLDNDHISHDPDGTSTSNFSSTTTESIPKESVTSTITSTRELMTVSTENTSEIHSDSSTIKENVVSTESSIIRGNSMINLRSVLPTEILSAPSQILEDTTVDLLDVTEPTKAETFGYSESIPTEISKNTMSTHDITVSSYHTLVSSNVTEPTITEIFGFSESSPTDINKNTNTMSSDDITSSSHQTVDLSHVTKSTITEAFSLSESSPTETSGNINTESSHDINVSTNATESTFFGSSISNEASSTTFKTPDITSETEFSSLPIETSDQNPHENDDKDTDKPEIITTIAPVSETILNEHTIEEVFTVSTDQPMKYNDESTEVGEATEYIVTPYDPEGSGNGAVEVIKIYPDGHETSEIVAKPTFRTKGNILSDLINIVGDVASITDHTGVPSVDSQQSNPSVVSNSEELMPVNAGYKSKNSNWNLNSITEVPFKTKNVISVNKQKVVEIEDDETDGSITDSPAPFDKIEPTTRRHLIDNVSDNYPDKKTDTNKKDIEIITQSYVPTINKRPTKVILQDENSFVSEESTTMKEAAVTIDFFENNITNATSTTTEFPDSLPNSTRQSTVEQYAESTLTTSTSL